MRVLSQRRRGAAALAAVLAVLGAFSLPGGPAQAAPGGQGGSGDCYPVGTTWICVYSGGGPGGGGPGGSSTYNCTYTKAPAGILQRTGTGPPAPGFQWDIMSCPGSAGPFNGELIQVNIKTGVPAVTPFDLFKIAIGDLRVPTLAAATAPPRGKDGLVGLPEWFWVPSGQWQPVSITVTAGPVWATAVATPTGITYDPGGGQASTGCAGPGTPFNRALPAGSQHTSCSYTYRQPSAGQPGDAYQAALFVTWTISWTGSGGAGGVVTNGYTTGTTFGVRVAQAEALVTTP